MSKAYWKKRNKRTDKISGALDDLIGISALMHKQSPQKKFPSQKKQSPKKVRAWI